MPQARSEPASGTPPFEVVMLGGDIGIYALARAFHEAYGVRSTVISRVPTGNVMYSRIIDQVLLGEQASAQDHLDELLRRGRERAGGPRSGIPVLLLANTDGYARMFAAHREALDEFYVLALSGTDVLDRVADKGRFAQACAELDIPTPRTQVQDFAGAGEPGWEPDPVQIDFPLIAKVAATSEYERITFEGKQKVFHLEGPEELAQLWQRLAAAGFRDRFLVQELIGGDDTGMRSLTAYRDHRGTVTLMAGAQVLLEEHTPLALGNPAAMVTRQFPEAMAQARALLDHLGYVGFANVDAKVDPRDGSFRFLEINPRIGRNNYYVTGAGANVTRFLVEDVVADRAVAPVTVTREILYSVLPMRLLIRYVVDPELRRRVRTVAKRGIVHPLAYRIEGWRHRGYIRLAQLNHVRKFARYYPAPTDSGF